MPELHSVVCVKVVPKPEEIRVDPQTRLLERANARSEINPPDMNALEMALGLKDRYGGRVSILSMGPPYFEPYLRVALAMGCDHIYLLSDRAFGGADTLATTYTLAQGLRKMGGADLVFCGEESSDGATGQVPAGLAEWLGVAQLTLLTEVEVDLARRLGRGRRSLRGGHEILEAPLPCVISVKTAANEPRFMDYRIKPWAFEPGRATVWSAADLEVEAERVGWNGSPTAVTGLAEAATRTRKRIFLEGSPQQAAQELAVLLEALI
ncbi:MAG: electron transfer flavoprotein subunit beta/FixA family protein [Anaerolineales bacterium]|nr:electron transfer flavoprotein subunit beta/FixA family protein [Anaerolineales bacterium]